VNRANELQKLSSSAQFGITKFMDITPEEFRQHYLMTKFTPSLPNNSGMKPEHVLRYTPNSANWDWSQVGAITPVYNQGQCGSPWAFSATECIESYWFLAGNPLYYLSDQEVIDCDTDGEDQGCCGGFPNGAFEYIAECGLETNSSYPYMAEDGTCKYNPKLVVVGVKGSTNLSGETGIYEQVSSAEGGGPVSVCVDATQWQYYTGGVITNCTDIVDHCAQVTGYANYGEDNAYWIVRNQWGTEWGVSGYIFIAIGHDLCGIGDYASIPIVSPPPANPPQKYCSGSSL